MIEGKDDAHEKRKRKAEKGRGYNPTIQTISFFSPSLEYWSLDRTEKEKKEEEKQSRDDKRDSY